MFYCRDGERKLDRCEQKVPAGLEEKVLQYGAKANENYCSLLLARENIFYLAGCRRRFSMPFELKAAERLRTQTTVFLQPVPNLFDSLAQTTAHNANQAASY